jgi:uncharacterized protein DUF6884/GIY-YIG catalytic domain-containing protein
VLLVACAKSKLTKPAAAKDLYISPRFRKARAYGEASGAEWFILSAEHGLVAPDEWLAPYDRYLPDTPNHYRVAWGEWVAARLALLLNEGLSGLAIEMHAGDAYLRPLLAPLERRGATIERPLQGLTSGRWQSWYDERAKTVGPSDKSAAWSFRDDPSPVIAALADSERSDTPAEIAALERLQLDGPGLYSWFVDQDGAEQLSRGLGQTVAPGLVYVGQTGATRWPSGRASGSTLLKRVKEQHLNGSRTGSTLRLTLGSILDVSFEAPVLREALSEWMRNHLRVVPLLIEDADSLGDLESHVVRALDPPLNLDHVERTELRKTLGELRVRGSRTG